MSEVIKRSNQSGFSLIEMVIVVTMIASLTAMAFPQARETLIKESVRGARRVVATQLARARGTAANRGCRAVFHLVGGSDPRVWVTSCPLTGGGVDTVGTVEHLADRFSVDLATTGDSIVFSPNGIGAAPSWTSIAIKRSEAKDTLSISPIGRAAW
jgi:prepilin-type N-terminal cleavage/methylation domain-containing protein